MDEKICADLGEQGVEDGITELTQEILDILFGDGVNALDVKALEQFLSHFLPNLFLP